MIEISDSLSIDDSELQLEYVRASGPGGQNVNKVATAVQLRFDVLNSATLPEEAKAQLLKLAGSRATQQGVLVMEAKRFRTQEKNREDALARFTALVRKALEKPKKRVRTKPSAAAVQKRLEEKKQRGERKRSRQRYAPDE